MKAIISTTYDDKYLFFLPIVTWCWNRLGVDVVCFMPEGEIDTDDGYGNFLKKCLITDVVAKKDLNLICPEFQSPKHKEATYAQCSRLYGACLDLPEDEVLITSDVDMAVFRLPPIANGVTVFGADLVPDKQFPMCYLTGRVMDWRVLLDGNKSYQENLDELLGSIEAEHFRGNYWGKDQETAYNLISKHPTLYRKENRARPQTQFASNRIDRDDSFWEERLNLDVIDAHLWRPGYTDENFPKIIELIHYFYPNEDLQWMWDYREAYLKLL